MSRPATQNELINDLYQRTREAIRALVEHVRETGEPLERNAIVDAVQDILPTDYPTNLATKMDTTVRRLIRDIANDITENLLKTGGL